MNEREEMIVLAVLKSLKTLEGYSVPEAVLHAEVNLRVIPNARLSEFDQALKLAETKRWILSVRSKLGAVKWSLTDEGMAAYLELCK